MKGFTVTIMALAALGPGAAGAALFSDDALWEAGAFVQGCAGLVGGVQQCAADSQYHADVRGDSIPAVNTASDAPWPFGNLHGGAATAVASADLSDYALHAYAGSANGTTRATVGLYDTVHFAFDPGVTSVTANVTFSIDGTASGSAYIRNIVERQLRYQMYFAPIAQSESNPLPGSSAAFVSTSSLSGGWLRLTQTGDFEQGLTTAITISADTPDYALSMFLDIWAYAEGDFSALMDFGNTSRFTIDLPEGVTMTSAALGGAAEVPTVPLPGGLGLALSSAGLLGLLGRRRLRAS